MTHSRTCFKFCRGYHELAEILRDTDMLALLLTITGTFFSQILQANRIRRKLRAHVLSAIVFNKNLCKAVRWHAL